MDRYQFEDNISNYIENSLTLQKRKEFEQYLEGHPESVELVEQVRMTIQSMQTMPEVKTSTDFMDRLSTKIELEKNRSARKISPQNTVFGFTPVYAGLMSVVIVGLVFVGLTLMPNPVQTPGMISPHITEAEDLAPASSVKSEDYMVEVGEDSLDHETKDTHQNRAFDNRIHLVKDNKPSFK